MRVARVQANGYAAAAVVALGAARAQAVAYAAAAAVLILMLFRAISPEYLTAMRLPPDVAQAFTIRAADELSGLVAMLVALATGLFVVVGLVGGRALRPTQQTPPGHACVLILFVLCSAASFYFAYHARLAISIALAAGFPSGALYEVRTLIATQALCLLLALACAVGFAVDAGLRVLSVGGQR